MKRVLDIIFSIILLIICSPLFFIISCVIKLDSEGPVFFKQRRIGKGNKAFIILKFRTMKPGTPDLPTHLINPSDYVTKIGKILRKSSLDELPQLFNILIGNMSFVGPRPSLYNQQDLIEERTTRGIHNLIPGVTGWAQINGRDEISTFEKVYLDEYYYINRTLLFDLKIILLTFVPVLKAKNIKV